MHDTDKAPAHAPLRLYGEYYLHFLQHLNTHLTPRSYLEIGTNAGESLACMTCDAIAIDPSFTLTANVFAGKRRLHCFQMPSDDFFRDHDVRAFFPRGVDLAFLDGMHRFEYLLRDFINTEAAAHPRSLILMHDCLPLNARMARRSFAPGPAEEGDTASAWTGDVWKILPILKRYRPDLRIQLLDCPPTGLVAVSRLDPASTVLATNYHSILDAFAAVTIEAYGLELLWGEFPLVDTAGIVAAPDSFTAQFSVC